MNKRLTPFAYALALLPAAGLAQTVHPEAGTLEPRLSPPVPKPAAPGRVVVAPKPAAPAADIA